MSIAEPGSPLATCAADPMRSLSLLLVEVEAGCDTGLILVIIHTHLVENV